MPAVWWEHNGCRLPTDRRYKIGRDGDTHSLNIVTPLLRDAGPYTCHVENPAGSVTHICHLTVNPRPPGIHSRETTHRKDTVHTKDTVHSKDTVHNRDGVHNIDAVHNKSNIHSKDTVHNKSNIHSKDPVHNKSNIHSKDTVHNNESTLESARDYRTLLKPRRAVETDVQSERSDKDEVRDFRHIIGNKRQAQPCVSTTVTTTTTCTTTTAATAWSCAWTLERKTEDVPKAVRTDRGSSPAGSLSSLSSGVGRTGGVLRNLRLFETRAATSPDIPAVRSRHSASPAARPEASLSAAREPRSTSHAQERLPQAEEKATRVQQRLSRAEERLPRAEEKPIRVQERPFRAQEAVLSESAPQQSQSRPDLSRTRFNQDPEPVCSQTEVRNSVKTDFAKRDRSEGRHNGERVENRPNRDRSEVSRLNRDGSEGSIHHGDFRSVLRKKSLEVNGHNKMAADRSADSRPSWQRAHSGTDKNSQPVDRHDKHAATNLTDFRSVLKKRHEEKERNVAAVATDSKNNVRGGTDFRAVLSKMKCGGQDARKVVKAEELKCPADLRTLGKAVSKDVHSIKSKFEAPAKDFRTVQLKPPQSQTVNHSTNSSTDSKSPAAGAEWQVNRTRDSSALKTSAEKTRESAVKVSDRTRNGSPLNTTAERSRDTTPMEIVPDSAKNNMARRTAAGQPVDLSSLKNGDSKRDSSPLGAATDKLRHTPARQAVPEKIEHASGFRAERWRDIPVKSEPCGLADSEPGEKSGGQDSVLDDSKCSESSQLSDSAISSAFSKLSEFSDLSDGGSPAPEADPRDTRRRHRLERLKAEYGGGDGGGWEEEKEEMLEAPSIQRRLEDRSVTYGGQAVLQCSVFGTPPPNINWSVNSKTIKPSKFFQLSYRESIAQLVVAEAFSEDEGEYTCTATNSAGSDSCSCYLTVEASSSRSSRSGSHTFEGPVSTPPHVTSLTPHVLTVRQGQPAMFQLTFTGEPPPVVRWFRAKTPLEDDGHYNISADNNNSKLSISAATANDSGRYTVTITNDLGTDLQAATLSVEDVPECPVGKPHVYDVSKQSVSLSWCGPAYDGGSAVTHYAIEVQDSNSDAWTTLVADCKSTSHHALNLRPDINYQFRVLAANRLGFSEPSLASDPVMLMDPLHSSEDYESDNELPFEPREVSLTADRKFEDHYEYLHEVGHGRFGSVYKCKSKENGKMWAAKVLKVREKDKAVVRQEVEVMNKLTHPKLLMLWDAFEAARTMILVMEYVGAGELFERVIREDFVLTERDCVHFVRQICSGVGYMHSQSILHLDLKPENVLCVSDNSNQIKIIDFGLARFFKPGDSLQVLSGTPEFVAPEVINYDEISFSTDMWSIGVICYILLSGLSPFQGDDQAETLANVTSGDFDFDDESFDDISDNAKDFIRRLLIKRKEKRSTILQCDQHPWLAQEDKRIRCKRLNTDRLRCFMARRKWQKTGNAIRALGRMASMQKLLTGGSTSQSGSSSLSSLADIPSPLPRSADDPFSTSGSKPEISHPLTIDTERVAGDGQSAGPKPTTVSSKEWGREKYGEVDIAAPSQPDPVKTTSSSTPLEVGTTITQCNDRKDNVKDSSTSLEAVSVYKMDVTDSFQAPISNSPPASPRPGRRASNTLDTTNNFSPSQATRAPREGGASQCDLTEAPRFLKEMVDCQAFEGDVVRFDVTVTGQPTPQLLWMMEEEEVEEDERHILELGEKGQYSLIVRHVNQDDEGEYSCKAVNSQGEVICFAELSIYGMGSV